jgi:molybdopterin synthase sulfur carrier subunit
MARVRLRNPLRELAGGHAEHELAAATVLEALRALERAHPATAGWVLDERGRIRRHINVFVNGEQGGETTPLEPADRVEIIPAISGGCEPMGRGERGPARSGRQARSRR